MKKKFFLNIFYENDGKLIEKFMCVPGAHAFLMNEC